MACSSAHGLPAQDSQFAGLPGESAYPVSEAEATAAIELADAAAMNCRRVKSRLFICQVRLTFRPLLKGRAIHLPRQAETRGQAGLRSFLLAWRVRTGKIARDAGPRSGRDRCRQSSALIFMGGSKKTACTAGRKAERW